MTYTIPYLFYFLNLFAFVLLLILLLLLLSCPKKIFLIYRTRSNSPQIASVLKVIFFFFWFSLIWGLPRDDGQRWFPVSQSLSTQWEGPGMLCCSNLWSQGFPGLYSEMLRGLASGAYFCTIVPVPKLKLTEHKNSFMFSICSSPSQSYLLTYNYFLFIKVWLQSQLLKIYQTQFPWLKRSWLGPRDNTSVCLECSWSQLIPVWSPEPDLAHWALPVVISEVWSKGLQ